MMIMTIAFKSYFVLLFLLINVINSEMVYLVKNADLSKWTVNATNSWQYLNNEWRICSFGKDDRNSLITKYFKMKKPTGNIFVAIETTNRKCSSLTQKYCDDNIGIYISQEGKKPTYLQMLPNVNTALFPMFYTYKNVIEIKKASSEFKLVFVSTASCTRITELSIFYYACPTSTEQLAIFPRVKAPNTGFINIEGDCVRNALKNATVTMSCYHNGTFNVQNRCICKEGFSPNENLCQVCPDGNFKSAKGNNNCFPCGKNSMSNIDRTKCICNINHFRVKQEELDSQMHCYDAAPVRRLIYSNFSDGSVLLQWNVPIRKTGYNPIYLVTYNNVTKRTKDRTINFKASKRETKSYVINIVTEISIGNKTYRSASLTDRITVHRTHYNRSSVTTVCWINVIVMFLSIALL